MATVLALFALRGDVLKAKIPEGWDMDAALQSGPVMRAVELVCFAAIVFDAWWFEMVFMRAINGKWWWM